MLGWLCAIVVIALSYVYDVYCVCLFHSECTFNYLFPENVENIVSRPGLEVYNNDGCVASVALRLKTSSWNEDNIQNYKCSLVSS